jgi:hypothetical protein
MLKGLNATDTQQTRCTCQQATASNLLIVNVFLYRQRCCVNCGHVEPFEAVLRQGSQHTHRPDAEHVQMAELPGAEQVRHLAGRREEALKVQPQLRIR